MKRNNRKSEKANAAAKALEGLDTDGRPSKIIEANPSQEGYDLNVPIAEKSTNGEYRLTREELRVRQSRAAGKILRATEVKRRGNKCEKCPYSKHPEILQFHHIDPKTKNGDVSPMFILVAAGKLKRAVLDRELTLTILVCPNCHAEIHLKDK